MRLTSAIAFLLGIALLPVSVGLAAFERVHRRAALESVLSEKAHNEAAALSSYFARARSIDLLTAHNPGFVDFYTTGGRRGHGPAHRRALTESTGALDYLESLYSSSIGEACFIDRAGAENARVVRGTAATTKDLSPDESGNPFFAPTFVLPAGRVYQARPYVSPDTKGWVISNSTVVPMPDRGRPAIVHFEVTIESFRRAAAAVPGHFGLRVVDARTGRVIIDARSPQRLGAPLGAPRDERFTSLKGATSFSGRATFGGRPSVYRRVDGGTDNANRWYVVASSRQPAPSLLGSAGIPSLAVALLGAVLLGFGVASRRTLDRELKTAATTDALTGLFNRRQLMVDIERAAGRASVEEPLLLVLLDLNGFKLYNDSFGHAAGDALLVRLGAALRTAMAEHARVYRLGGDEFCVLAKCREAQRESIAARAAHALSERGDGFSISASYGAAVLPREAAEPSEALQIADQRMYAQKNGGRPSAVEQSAAVLLQALEERQPALGTHVDDVGELAEAVGRELGLAEADLERVRKAGQLHDIGKVAIPDAILDKPAALDDHEWEFMKRHTLVGERIVGAAPALAPIGRLIRSSHERWDGAGYPDALCGEEIPLGARIVSVCDAYDAIVTDRPYRHGASHEEAIAEIRRCAGSQFDPVVVDAFCRAMTPTATAAVERAESSAA